MAAEPGRYGGSDRIRWGSTMEKLKKYKNKIKEYVTKKRCYWYLVLLVLLLIGLVNIELLSKIIPELATYIINVILIIMAIIYAKIQIDFLKKQIIDNIQEEKQNLYCFLENSFKRTSDEISTVDNNIAKCTDLLCDEMGNIKQKVLSDLESIQQQTSEEIFKLREHEDKMYDVLREQIKWFEADNKKQLDRNVNKVLNLASSIENRINKQFVEQTNNINEFTETNKANINASKEILLQKIDLNGHAAEENTQSIKESLEEVRYNFIKNVTELLEKTGESIQNARKENADNFIEQNRELTIKLESVINENKNNRDAIATTIDELHKTRNLIIQEIADIDSTNQIITKECCDAVEEQICSIDDKLIKEFSNVEVNIIDQTSELIEKLNNVIAENKNNSMTNFAEIQKSCDAIIDNMAEIDKKRIEYDTNALESVHNKANEIITSENDVTNKLNEITALVKEYEQKTSVAISESSVLVSNQINTKTKEAINEVEKKLELTSNYVSTELAAIKNLTIEIDEKRIEDDANAIEGVYNKANEISDRVIDLIEKNNIESKENIIAHKNEILQSIDNKNSRIKENFICMSDLLDDVKSMLDAMEKEISNINHSNIELTEELKDIFTSKLQVVNEGVKSINDNQQFIVDTMVKSIDAKFMILNQELVKQVNVILDKSDENNDYISGKCNVVFEQIQLLSKESKLLINKLDDSINKNKNNIIQNQKNVINVIENGIQDIKNNKKNLDMIEMIADRNFSNINNELEIVKNQLSSLNSLTVLIRSLSQNKDEKIEKKENRIETIEMPEDGIIVKEEYKHNKLIKSEMLKKGKKLYEAFFGSEGKFLNTRQYDDLGNVVMENIYYPNGQVKERREYSSGKAKITMYDANGTKIN